MAKQIVKYVYADIKFTIKELFGYWYLDFYLPSGQRKRGTTKEKASQSGLRIVKKQIIPDIVVGLGKEPEKCKDEYKEWTLNEFAQEYFELQKTQLREHTLYRNICHYRKQILPYFGHRLLTTLTPLDLEKWQNQLLSKYKHSTVQRYRSILYSMFKKAFINDIIPRNPLEKVTAPKMLPNAMEEEESQDPFTQDEINTIMSHATGYMANFIKIMLSTGMRPGELVALTWTDIDFSRKIISVNKTRLRSPRSKAVVDGPVKTNAGKRSIDLFPATEKAFLEQQELTGWQKYIFLNPSNRPFYNHDVIGVNFRNILKRSSIKERVLYNLRHTFASQLISNGADIVYVSKTLGHKDVSITLKIYTKFIKEEDAVRLEKMKKIDKFMVKFENDD
ncbi:tyrosine-type recombinase/integrase [Sulfurospirillum deleyianum]|uniref:Integrase family protein n=1 Tax=Sulfurospirillum deleyianum (strain ATCC 51133 / DSM 6946 / 5175) TaxID=525898 RepID=D1B2E2_SULD5|nr:site-specific integrase [Sulfurospirillum deleyianum]ACZ12262.1 integrase family protein [Sulfurospirillum deleyianum DSM 6946]